MAFEIVLGHLISKFKRWHCCGMLAYMERFITGGAALDTDSCIGHLCPASINGHVACCCCCSCHLSHMMHIHMLVNSSFKEQKPHMPVENASSL